ncbi:MAG: helix-turn-helix transcriptional regulator [Clostridia bacterium]|nr:helix-turn-helix transcriptional regulator [Clostridia bacterium]
MKNTIKIEIIEKYMLKNNISKTKFCKICKISPNTLNKIMANDFNFEIVALFKIARIIKIEVYQMFN